jgi:hypothetical protein
MGTSINPPPASTEPEDFEEYSDDDEDPRIIPEIDEPANSTGKLLNQQPAYGDQIISAEVQLQLGDEVSAGQVKRRALSPDGTVVGNYHNNPIMNSIKYEVEFPDGQVKEFAAVQE